MKSRHLQIGNDRAIQLQQDGFVKFTDNATLQKVIVLDGGNNLGKSRKGKLSVKNDSGFLFDVDVEENFGIVSVDFSNEKIEQLPVGSYQFEITLTDDDGKNAIYPDSGFGQFTITQNAKAVNGSTVSGFYIDDVMAKVKKLLAGAPVNNNGETIDEDNLVHRTGNETIQGVKQFKNTNTIIKIDGNGITQSNDGGQTFTAINGSGKQGPQGPKGEPGKDGTDGKDGANGKDGTNGVDGKNGTDGKDGKDGLSAYELAVKDGFTGTEQDYQESLKGPKGDKGEPGKDGTNGKDGAQGADGKSAYQLAVANGFVGDEKSYLASLVGKQGATGGQGVDLDNWNKFKAAKDGLPSTQAGIDMWYIMTNPEWFAWLWNGGQWWYIPDNMYVSNTYFYDYNGGVFKNCYLHWEVVNGYVRFDLYPNNFEMPGDFSAYHMFFKKQSYKWPYYKWQDDYLPDIEESLGVKSYGLPNLTLGGSMDGIDNKNAVKMTFKLTDAAGSIISQGWASVRTQGDSSSMWEKKNYRMKFYSDESMKNNIAITINPEMVPQSDVTIKANYIDDSQARNNVLQQINRDIVTNRPNLPESFDNTLNYGAVEGYPMTLNLTSQPNPFNGLYTWNYGSKALLYGLDKNSTQQICIEGANGDGWGLNFRVTSIPKPDGTNGWDLNSYSWTDENQATVNKLFNFVATSSPDDFKNGIGELVDLTSVYDYIAFETIIDNVDAWRKNQTFVTWDSKKWYMMSYDLDNTLGLDWKGNLNTGISKIGNVPYMMDHYLIERVLGAFKDDFKKRYWQLRSNELKEANMAERFKRWMEQYPQVLIDMEHKRWPNKPSIGQSDFNYLQHAIVKQARAVDAWVNAL